MVAFSLPVGALLWLAMLMNKSAGHPTDLQAGSLESLQLSSADPPQNMGSGMNGFSDATFVIEDCPEPCNRTCKADARVALWKYRQRCDFKGRQDTINADFLWDALFERECDKAPSVESCCKDPKKQPKHCKTWWPKDDKEAAWCRHGCFWLRDQNCTISAANPDICLCMYPNCIMNGTEKAR